MERREEEILRGSNQKFCIVNDGQKTLIDCDKLFDFVGLLAKENGVKVE